VLVQGFTGKASTFHGEIAQKFGTNIVGGVSPKGGPGVTHMDKPVFKTVREAAAELKPYVSSVFVPALLAADAIIEAIEAEIPLIAAYAEGVPQHDQLRIHAALRSQSKSRLVGANCPGLANAYGCKLGIVRGCVRDCAERRSNQ